MARRTEAKSEDGSESVSELLSELMSESISCGFSCGNIHEQDEDFSLFSPSTETSRHERSVADVNSTFETSHG